MSKPFTVPEWRKINETLDADPDRYGLPQRDYGSVLLGSFNIRTLGQVHKRSDRTWEFLARACAPFDLLAIQEIADNLEGLRKLKGLLGPEFGLVVSDRTGAYPGDRGLAERLGFIYRWRAVERMEIASDITHDKTKIIESIAANHDTVAKELDLYKTKLANHERGVIEDPPKLELSTFVSFIRQPYCVSFQIPGLPGTDPYQFMAINAHLIYGEKDERRQEFHRLLDWIMSRFKQKDRSYFENFILLGDLNMDFYDPNTDRAEIEDWLKKLDESAGDGASVNFPFLDPHRGHDGPFRTNARQKETFDHIALFSRDARLPTSDDNPQMGPNGQGPDYGVFNFANLFSEALLGCPIQDLPPRDKNAFIGRFQFKVSDHMPLWLRLPLPR